MSLPYWSTCPKTRHGHVQGVRAPGSVFRSRLLSGLHLNTPPRPPPPEIFPPCNPPCTRALDSAHDHSMAPPTAAFIHSLTQFIQHGYRHPSRLAPKNVQLHFNYGISQLLRALGQSASILLLSVRSWVVSGRHPESRAHTNTRLKTHMPPTHTIPSRASALSLCGSLFFLSGCLRTPTHAIPN